MPAWGVTGSEGVGRLSSAVAGQVDAASCTILVSFPCSHAQRMRWVTSARPVAGRDLQCVGTGQQCLPTRLAAHGIAEYALVGDRDPAEDVGVPRIRVTANAGGCQQHVRFDRSDEAVEALRLVHSDRAGEAGVLPRVPSAHFVPVSSVNRRVAGPVGSSSWFE